MLIAAGKHYINTGEISSVQYIDTRLGISPIRYEFAMKSGGYIQVTEEEFKEFKEKCGRLLHHVFQM